MTATWSTGGFLACSPPCMAVSRAHQGQPSAIKRHHCRIYNHDHHHHDLVRWLPEELLFRRCKAAGGEKQQKKGNAVHPSSISHLFFPPPLFRPILRPISESDFHAGDDRPLLFLSLWYLSSPPWKDLLVLTCQRFANLKLTVFCHVWSYEWTSFTHFRWC